MNPSNTLNDEQTPQTDLQQQPNGKRHTFSYCYENKTYAVSCDTSKMLYVALDTSQAFKQLKEKNKDKELLIKREKEPWEITGAAVKSDFPCCLIQKDEILNIDFIQVRESKNQEENENQEQNENQKQNEILSHDPEMLVTFNIKTKGGGELKRIMKNMELGLEVEDVCVYGFKGKTLKDALSRDGRFIEEIFKRNCVLQDLASNIMYELTNNVDYINRKIFQIIVMRENIQVVGQKNKTTIKSKSEGALAEGADPNKSTPKTKGKQRKTTECKRPSIKCEIIPDSQEIVKDLCGHYEKFLYQLNQQMNEDEIQNFFKTEFDKSKQSFSEVKTVKKLMGLSNSVCQIQFEGSARGTGFLLFDRFILTCAHVIKHFELKTMELSHTCKAMFTFGDSDSKVITKKIKKHIVAYSHGKDENKNHLDFALLELEKKILKKKFPELLSRYTYNSLPGENGEICIVGHPDGGVKQMDPCFMIGKENQLMAAYKHIYKNINFYHAMRSNSLKEKWDFKENQISYHSCFFHGSSGSPVFDNDCCLIGIHTGGYLYPGEGKKTRSIMEYGYSMKPILKMIIKQLTDNGRSDILDLMSKLISLNMEPEDVEMEEPQD